MRTPKENKQKLRARTPKSTAGTIPKAALKAAWLKTKEQPRTTARENDDDLRQQQPTDLAGSAAEQSAAFVRHQGRKLAETQARQHRQKEAVARAHAASERGVSPKQAGRGTLPDADQRPRGGADLPRQRAKEKAVTAKTVPRDIRGVTQSKRQLRTAVNETVRSVTTQAQMHTRTRQVQLAIQKAASNTRRTVTAVRSAIRHFLASLHSLVAAIVVGISVALSIIITEEIQRLGKQNHNLERLRTTGCIDSAQYWERRAVIEQQLIEKKALLMRRFFNKNVEKVLRQTKGISTRLAAGPPLTDFDEAAFTALVSRVEISSTAIIFGLINGMKLTEGRTEP